MGRIAKATKKRAKLRAALFGPAGSGKTMSALRIATGLGGRIGVIDTERGSASLYADRFHFDVLELGKGEWGVRDYCEAIREMADAGIEVLVIDSLSHCWQELLQEVEQIAKARYRGNTWSAWSEGTPLQRDLVDALLTFPGHVLATMRSKTEWTTGESKSGKTTPQRVGLAPEQGKGIEYEFSLLIELAPDHTCNIIKDRTGKFQDQFLAKPGEDFGRQLAVWLADGAEPPDPALGEFEAWFEGMLAQIRKRWASTQTREPGLPDDPNAPGLPLMPFVLLFQLAEWAIERSLLPGMLDLTGMGEAPELALRTALAPLLRPYHADLEGRVWAIVQATVANLRAAVAMAAEEREPGSDG